MKKLFAMLLCGATYLTASSQEKGDFELGINSGLNLATVTSGSNTNTEYRTGVNVTVSGDYFFSDRWSIKAKAAYDQKGWNNGYISFDNGEAVPTNYQFDYLTVPVMANWHFGKTRNWYLNFGPYAGFLLSSKETAMGTDLKEISQSVDAGLALGIGVKIPVSSRVKILLETDGQAGLTDVFKDNQGNKIQNSRSSLNAGLVFGL
ncbi:porin family protein [Pedobacter faecalis]|uniref:porin family protein n=1 Tax=Pedobacter faecalis TaxID=3041495 RepID=UPI00254DBE12|nr:porin family protein [Pedobacter sp. ELA7]